MKVGILELRAWSPQMLENFDSSDVIRCGVTMKCVRPGQQMFSMESHEILK